MCSKFGIYLKWKNILHRNKKEFKEFFMFALTIIEFKKDALLQRTQSSLLNYKLFS